MLVIQIEVQKEVGLNLMFVVVAACTVLGVLDEISAVGDVAYRHEQVDFLAVNHTLYVGEVAAVFPRLVVSEVQVGMKVGKERHGEVKLDVTDALVNVGD